MKVDITSTSDIVTRILDTETGEVSPTDNEVSKMIDALEKRDNEYKKRKQRVMKKVFSHNGEEYHTHLDTVFEHYFADKDYLKGDEIEIYHAEQKDYKAGDFFDYSFDSMIESASWDSDLVDMWNVSGEDEKLLINMLKNTVDEWADKTNNHPTFYGVTNVKKVVYVFNGDFFDHMVEFEESGEG